MSDIRKSYHSYLRLERGLSANSVEAYERDLDKLYEYMDEHGIDPVKATLTDLQEFIYSTFSAQSNSRTQARVISGIHSFYKFLVYNRTIEQDPSELIDMPKKERHLPEVLSVEEIDAMIEQIDLSSPQGHRNRAIIEMLYGSGLRVSELTDLKLSDIYLDEGYMLIKGKGSKQRLVPISPES